MKSKDHREITRYTIHRYVNLFGDGFRSMLIANKEYIIDGTYDEDNWFKDHKRITNWHFAPHPNNRNIDHFVKVFKFNLYSKQVYQGHIDDFVKSLRQMAQEPSSEQKGKETFTHVGGLLHHIQDMCTPSHIIPVFHGKVAPGTFEAVEDRFEQYSANNIVDHLDHHTTTLKMPDDIPDDTSDYTFWDIYRGAADETRNILAGFTFPVKVGAEYREVGSEVFWQEYDYENAPETDNETAGFGRYGCLAQLFGKTNIQTKPGPDGPVTYDAGCTAEIDGEQWTIRFEDYVELYFQLIRNAIINTLRCLRLVDRYYKAVISQ